jgi:two-component system sensor histidine kinase KdpD
MNFMDDVRPDPDELLASLKNEEEKRRRGSLKIFFGMCAGVGKTHTMLETALIERSKGIDVVIGYIETHNRKEIEELASRFEFVPRKSFDYRSTSLPEMDIDRVLTRKPQLVMVDELAHTNAPGSRHSKRMQDVIELLENGINVFTTLNVQHIESRSEIVAQITGITVRETVPDEIFENADEVELVDLTPEELLMRLSEGKVYAPEQSADAMANFFKKGNITALREMALRIVADRVDRQLQDYLKDNRIKGPWKSGLHLLVAMGPSPYSGRLLRWAKILSYSMGATIQAVYIESAGKLSSYKEELLNKNINLARKLGIKLSIVTDIDRVKGILNFAQKEHVTHIIVGKPRTRSLLSLLRLGNFVNRLIRFSGNIDVYILGAETKVRDRFRERISLPSFTSGARQYLIVSFFVILSSIISYPLTELIGYQAVSFILLFVVSILALFYGIGPILLAATSCAFIWDYFFIPPRFTFHIEKPLDIMMLIMFFIIALLNGILTSRVRRQEKKIRVREERTQALYQLSKDLNSVVGNVEVIKMARSYVQKYFQLNNYILLRDQQGQIQHIRSDPSFEALTDNDISIAEWVLKNTQKAGKFTDTLPSSRFTFYPLIGTSGNIGAIVVQHSRRFTFGEEQFWDACVSQISAKFDREYLMEEARKSYVLNESEKLYKTLFNSISHELRIPVTTILAASDSLLSPGFSEESRVKLGHEINMASLRLNRLIENLLNMSRLESGRITPQPDWCDVHDLSSKVMESLQNELKSFKLVVTIPEGMPLVRLDYGLMEQVVQNLVLNATQHAPEGTQIRLKFYFDNGFFILQVMDRGKGFTSGELDSVFDKFYRGKNAVAGGTGLGLSIVKGFVEAHKGTVIAENRQNGGAKITVRIPTSIPDL